MAESLDCIVEMMNGGSMRMTDVDVRLTSRPRSSAGRVKMQRTALAT